MKYKCPLCLIKSCSLICINEHKSKSGCLGKKPSGDQSSKLYMKEMNIGILRKDMGMLERVINRSNKSKRENAQAKEQVDVDFNKVKRMKTLRTFLRKNRGIF